jgi:hypothetical protein
VLGHLAYIEAMVVREFMLGEPNPLAAWKDVFDGPDPSADIGQYPPFDEVSAAMSDRARVDAGPPDSLSEDRLDSASANVPKGYEENVRHVSPVPAICSGPLVHAPRTPRRCPARRWSDRMWV